VILQKEQQFQLHKSSLVADGKTHAAKIRYGFGVPIGRARDGILGKALKGCRENLGEARHSQEHWLGVPRLRASSHLSTSSCHYRLYSTPFIKSP